MLTVPVFSALGIEVFIFWTQFLRISTLIKIFFLIVYKFLSNRTMLWLERLPRTAFLLFLQEIVQYSLSIA